MAAKKQTAKVSGISTKKAATTSVRKSSATKVAKAASKKTAPEQARAKPASKRTAGAKSEPRKNVETAPAVAAAASEAPLGPGPHDAVVRALRAFGLSYPEAHTKSPWPGHLDLAVRDKTFAYLSLDGEPLRIGCKLPHSCQTALSLPFAQPTPYGLGKSGWVTATFEPSDEPPLEFLEAWIDESYRAVAPKTLVKKLTGLR
jgi:hypothetical protein